MRNILLLIIWVLYSLNVSSQESIFKIQARKDSIEFSKMVSYFDSVHYTELSGNFYTRIPSRLYYKFFRVNFNENIVSVDPFMKIGQTPNVSMIVQINYPEGGFSCSYLYGVFKPNGELIRKQNLGGSALDYGGGQNCSINKINENLLEVISYTTRGDDETEKIVGQVDYYYYQLKPETIWIVQTEYSFDRRFKQSSIRVLSRNDLDVYSMEQLDIMRNEIFADHGYIFKSEKWIEYFKNEKWYVPRYENVDNQLSLIEKENVKRILSIKKQ